MWLILSISRSGCTGGRWSMSVSLRALCASLVPGTLEGMRSGI